MGRLANRVRSPMGRVAPQSRAGSGVESRGGTRDASSRAAFVTCSVLLSPSMQGGNEWAQKLFHKGARYSGSLTATKWEGIGLDGRRSCNSRVQNGRGRAEPAL